jgi:hypothetical protein
MVFDYTKPDRAVVLFCTGKSGMKTSLYKRFSQNYQTAPIVPLIAILSIFLEYYLKNSLPELVATGNELFPAMR